MSNRINEQKALFNYFYEIDPMLPRAIFAILKPCEDCTCKFEIEDDLSSFHKHFDEKAERCEQTYNKSIASLLNNPNVIAHIKYEETELDKLRLVISDIQKKAYSHKVITSFAL